MIANTAFLAAVTVFLVAAWLAGELTFLAPYKTALFRMHGMFIAGMTLLVFLNLCAAYYVLARWFFLREMGRPYAIEPPGGGQARTAPLGTSRTIPSDTTLLPGGFRCAR